MPAVRPCATTAAPDLGDRYGERSSVERKGHFGPGASSLRRGGKCGAPQSVRGVRRGWIALSARRRRRGEQRIIGRRGGAPSPAVTIADAIGCGCWGAGRTGGRGARLHRNGASHGGPAVVVSAAAVVGREGQRARPFALRDFLIASAAGGAVQKAALHRRAGCDDVAVDSLSRHQARRAFQMYAVQGSGTINGFARVARSSPSAGERVPPGAKLSPPRPARVAADDLPICADDLAASPRRQIHAGPQMRDPRAWRRVAPFCKGCTTRRRVEHRLGQVLLQPCVLVVPRLQPPGLGHVHIVEPCPPIVECRFPDPMPATPDRRSSRRPRARSRPR